MNQQGELKAVRHLELLENGGQMGLDRAFGNAQRFGDFGIGLAARGISGNGGLAFGQHAVIPGMRVLGAFRHQLQ
ncbi:hypothetical protein D3C73_1596570 [compost metagenome]